MATHSLMPATPNIAQKRSRLMRPSLARNEVSKKFDFSTRNLMREFMYSRSAPVADGRMLSMKSSTLDAMSARRGNSRRSRQ